MDKNIAPKISFIHFELDFFFLLQTVWLLLFGVVNIERQSVSAFFLDCFYSIILSFYLSINRCCCFVQDFSILLPFFVVVVLSATMLTMHLVCVCAHRCMTIPLRQFFSFGFFLSIIIMVGWWWRSSAFWWNPFPRSQILLFKLLFRLFVDRNKNKNKKISKSFSFF